MPYLYAALLGAFTTLGFAPFYGWPVPLLSIAFLHLLQADRTPHQSAVVGYTFGLGLFGSGVSWVYISLHTFGGMPAIMAGFATLMFCAFLALFPAVALWLTTKTDPARKHAWLVLPAAWLITEWTRGWLFTGFPWLSLGYAHTPSSPLIGWAPLCGIYGVGALSVMSSVLLTRALEQAISWSSRLRRLTLALTPILIGGLLHLTWTPTSPAGQELAVSLLQGNIQQDLKWDPQRVGQSLTTYADLARSSQGQLIIMPETAIPLFAHQVDSDYWRMLKQTAQSRGGDILLGIPQREGAHYFNAVISVGSAPTQQYRKSHLVPFGEFIPLGFQWILQWLHIPMSNFGRGTPDQPPLTVAGQQVAINICYEDAFGEEIIRSLPQATLLVNVSNDAWFGASLAPYQHLQIAQARAIEIGRPLLRATNTGVSAIIDHRGRILSKSQLFERTALEGRIQGRQGSTPYIWWGNGLVVGLALFILCSQCVPRLISGLRSRV